MYSMRIIKRSAHQKVYLSSVRSRLQRYRMRECVHSITSFALRWCEDSLAPCVGPLPCRQIKSHKLVAVTCTKTLYKLSL